MHWEWISRKNEHRTDRLWRTLRCADSQNDVQTGQYIILTGDSNSPEECKKSISVCYASYSKMCVYVLFSVQCVSRLCLWLCPYCLGDIDVNNHEWQVIWFLYIVASTVVSIACFILFLVDIRKKNQIWFIIDHQTSLGIWAWWHDIVTLV